MSIVDVSGQPHPLLTEAEERKRAFERQVAVAASQVKFQAAQFVVASGLQNPPFQETEAYNLAIGFLTEVLRD